MSMGLNFPGFEGQKIEYKADGVFRSPELFVNGQLQKPLKGKYELRNNRGERVIVQVKPTLVDVFPKLEVEGKLYSAVKPFAWYEYIWIGFPLVMVTCGGAIGGGLGAGAACINAYIFRSQLNTLLKYVLCAMISLVAIVLWLVSAAWLQENVYSKWKT